MKSRLGGVFFALLFAIPFGGVGAGAAWVIGQNVVDWNRAKDWVAVQATVEESGLGTSRSRKGGATYKAYGTYRYALDGKDYKSTRLGLDRIEGSDNIGDWQEEMASFLDGARSRNQTVTVYVNPADPAQAVVDRDLRVGWLAFVGLFAVLFGGVGVGALAVAGWALFGPSKEKVAERKAAAKAQASRTPGTAAPIPCDAASGNAALWIFAIFWNLIAFGATFAAVPQVIERGEYLGLFVLIFPLVGLLLLWGAIAGTLASIRRGPATLVLDPPYPKAGVAFSGVVRFAKPKPPGERYDVSATWSRKYYGSKSVRELESGETKTTASVSPGMGGESRLQFRLEVPAAAPATQDDEEARVRVEWHIEAERAGDESKSAFRFPFEMAPGAEVSRFAGQDVFASADPAPVQAADVPQAAAALQPAELRAAFASLGKPGGEARLQELLTQVGAVHGKVLEPDVLKNAVAAAGVMRKWAPRIAIAVAVVLGLQVIAGIVIAVVAASA